MCNLNVEFPEAYEYLKEGRFTASSQSNTNGPNYRNSNKSLF